MTLDTNLALLASVLLGAFTALAAIDGIYLHLWKYRLHARPETRREHALHTARSISFAPIALLLFGLPSGGALLWLGVAAAGTDTVVELWDVFVELDSRRELGGLSRGEYLLHVVLTMLRSAAIVLALVARPAAAWALDAPFYLAGGSPFGETLAMNLVPGAVIIALAHVWLGIRGARAVAAVARRGARG